MVTFPGSARIIRRLTPRDAWSAALFHHVASSEIPLTEGLGITYAPSTFRNWLRLFQQRATFVSLEAVIAGTAERPSDGRHPLLLTFDDAYASVARIAAPMCAELGIPSVFFVNSRFLDNRELALDNLVAAVINLRGMEPFQRVTGRWFRSADEVMTGHVAGLDLEAREIFRDDLMTVAGLDEEALLDQYQPYISSEELRGLRALGMEVANHTTSHVHCRVLDDSGVQAEVIENQRVLEELVGHRVRAFAYPYGRSLDATALVERALAASGHEVSFLVGGRLNPRHGSTDCVHRVSIKALSASEAMLEMELLPPLRELRSTLTNHRA